MNPVWKRELRARWRGWRAYALVFFMVVVLSAFFAWQYHDNTRYLTQDGSDPLQRLSLLGHRLFALLAWLQVVLWILLAPILTATSITTEREKGMLEGLQLSSLRAAQIVFGKLLSAISLAALLIVVTLPISATCFLMGGVSPGEFGMVLVLYAATAICCAAIGLAVSAWCRSSLTAIGLSIAAVSLWSGLAYVALIYALSPFMTASWVGKIPLELFAKMHPIMAVIETIGLFSRPGRIPWTITTPSWMLSLAFMLAFTVFNLFIASLGTRRILTDSFRIDWQVWRKKLQAADTTNLDASTAKPRNSTRKEKENNKRWELGALARLQFSNPVLGREVRACFRPRSTSIAMLILAIVLAPLGSGAYALGIYGALTDAQVRQFIGPVLLGLFLAMTIVICAIMSASALASEREGGTWETLHLSLLTPREILWGKLVAPLIVCGVCGLVFLPILLLCIRSVAYTGQGSQGLSLTQFLAALAIIFSCAWCFSLVGLLISQFSKRSVTAICSTLGVLFTMLLVPPVYGNTFGSLGTDDFLREWHPFMVLINLFDRKKRYHEYGEHLISTGTFEAALSCVLLLISIGCICYWALWRQLSSSKQNEAR